MAVPEVTSRPVDLGEAVGLLTAARQVVLLAHVDPDADALIPDRVRRALADAPSPG